MILWVENVINDEILETMTFMLSIKKKELKCLRHITRKEYLENLTLTRRQGGQRKLTHNLSSEFE